MRNSASLDAACLNIRSRTLHILTLSLLFAAALAALAAAAPDRARADGSCSTHYPYQVIDGHGHDSDGDGVGCESNPIRPDGESSDSARSSGYDRDNWGYDSRAGRARLGCTRAEDLDHIVALKEAYDSGASSWSSARKREFANDPLNQWCLASSLNRSKSDRDLAEWSDGSCEQRRFIAQRTRQVKTKYGLSIDPAERRANAAALAASCGLPPAQTNTNPASGLSSNRPGHTTWTGSAGMTAARLYTDLSRNGIRVIWLWSRGRWVGYAELGRHPVPGSFDFVIGREDRLYIGN